MQQLKSDKYPKYFLLSALSIPFALSLCVASPAQAVDQIAQAIPAVPPLKNTLKAIPVPVPAKVETQEQTLGLAPDTMVPTAPASGALGDAIDLASGSAEGDAKISNEQPSAITLPKVDDKPDQESRYLAEAISGAQSADSNNPVDLAPVKLPERTTAGFQTNQFQTGLLYKLPARMFFLSSTENSLRCETNVFQTLKRNRADMIYRVFPNVTVGYALTKTTRVAANYFFFRDQYTRNSHTLSRNIHSIGFQINQDIPISERTNITAGFMARQLLLSRSQPLSDLLPSVQITHRVGSNGVIYGGVLGQIRFRNTLGKFQEGDQFYSFGGIYRRPRWQFLWDNTFITNFGNRRLRFGPNNQNWIMTLQADYRVSPKLPLIAFVRAEPIFNIGANQAIGFAGFNFRIFGGLRIDLSKAPVFPVKTAK